LRVISLAEKSISKVKLEERGFHFTRANSLPQSTLRDDLHIPFVCRFSPTGAFFSGGLINRLIIDWTFKLRIWWFRFGSMRELDQVIFE
jgi:hypothetical protein